MLAPRSRRGDELGRSFDRASGERGYSGPAGLRCCGGCGTDEWVENEEIMARRPVSGEVNRNGLAGEKRVALGRPPVISLEDVLRAATQLAEEEGVDALTMGSVADALGVTSAALYHYVQNKQNLVNKVFERALERVQPPPPEAGPWDRRLKLFMQAIHAELRRLKWGSPPPLASDINSPDVVARLSAIVMDILSETGADEHEIKLAFTLVYVYFTGQLWYDNSPLHWSYETSTQALKVETVADERESDQFFDFAFDIVLAGLRDQLTPRRPSKLYRRR